MKLMLGRDIIQKAHRLDVGQSFCIGGRVLSMAFPNNPFTGEPGIERFKSNLIGHSWGAFLVTEDPLTMTTTVTRHEPGDRRVACDWDRRHLFKRNKDGYLESTD